MKNITCWGKTIKNLKSNIETSITLSLKRKIGKLSLALFHEKLTLTDVKSIYPTLCYRCPAGNYMFKVNNRNTTTRCEEICSKLTIMTPLASCWCLYC